jgi:hypothetical protein
VCWIALVWAIAVVLLMRWEGHGLAGQLKDLVPLGRGTLGFAIE